MKKSHILVLIVWVVLLINVKSRCWHNEGCSQRCKFKFCLHQPVASSPNSSLQNQTTTEAYKSEKCCLGCAGKSDYFEKESKKCVKLQSMSQSCNIFELGSQATLAMLITFGGIVMILIGAVMIYRYEESKGARQAWKFTGANDIQFR